MRVELDKLCRAQRRSNGELQLPHSFEQNRRNKREFVNLGQIRLFLLDRGRKRRAKSPARTGWFEAYSRFHEIICKVKKIKMEFANLAGYSLDFRS
jgi:hypothetical protein